MSARGVFIIRKNNEEKGLRIHCDAFPTRAGRDVVDMIKGSDLGKMFDLMAEDPGVNDRCFSRTELESHVLNNVPYKFRNEAGFIQDSSQCEHGYVVDLDESKLEYYDGFQDCPDPGNRYGTDMSCDGFYPCKMVTSFSLDYVKSHSTVGVVSQMGEEESFEDRSCLLHEDLLLNISDIMASLGGCVAALSAAGKDVDYGDLLMDNLNAIEKDIAHVKTMIA